jgi:hypothetical protein
VTRRGLRAVVFLLVVANVLLFAYARLERAAQSEGGRLAMQVEPRGQANGQSMIVVRDAREPIVARLRELQGQYAGTDVKVAACPTS